MVKIGERKLTKTMCGTPHTNPGFQHRKLKCWSNSAENSAGSLKKSFCPDSIRYHVSSKSIQFPRGYVWKRQKKRSL